MTNGQATLNCVGVRRPAACNSYDRAGTEKGLVSAKKRRQESGHQLDKIDLTVGADLSIEPPEMGSDGALRNSQSLGDICNPAHLHSGEQYPQFRRGQFVVFSDCPWRRSRSQRRLLNEQRGHGHGGEWGSVPRARFERQYMGDVGYALRPWQRNTAAHRHIASRGEDLAERPLAFYIGRGNPPSCRAQNITRVEHGAACTVGVSDAPISVHQENVERKTVKHIGQGRRFCSAEVK